MLSGKILNSLLDYLIGENLFLPLLGSLSSSFSLTILIEKEDTEYHIDLCKGDFQQLTIEIIQLMKNACRGDVEAQA